jgi:hypothetical protein
LAVKILIIIGLAILAVNLFVVFMVMLVILGDRIRAYRVARKAAGDSTDHSSQEG